MGQSSNAASVTINAAYTNALVCLQVQGTGTSGADYTSTGVKITIAKPTITQLSFSRMAKGETRTLTITGTGLNTNILLQINAGSSCDTNARICFKIPTNQGGTGGYETYSGSTMDIISLT